MLRLLSIVFTCLSISTTAQQSWRLSLLARWDNDNLPALGTQQYNEVWGWYDPNKQREYALLCSVDSLYFIDVTNAANPVLCDVEAGRTAHTLNRDITTYRHYAYAIAGQGNASLQIFDLQFLPDSVHKVYDHDSLCVRAHALCIDTGSARLYLCTNNCINPQNGLITPYVMSTLSISNPEKPFLLGHLQPPSVGGTPLFNFVHSAFAWKDTVYCSTGPDGLFIYDMRNVASAKIIKAIGDYPEKGFCHSPAFDPERRLLAFTDENHGLGVKLADVQQFSNISFKSIFRSSAQAIAHRVYFNGPLLWVSYYQDGVRCYDIRNAAQVRPAAWYDTYDDGGNYIGLKGCWGIYPYLPSGHVLASDMENGLFVLQNDTALAINPVKEKLWFTAYPSPMQDELTINSDTKNASLFIYNMQGVECMHITMDAETQIIPTGSLCPGIYTLRLLADGRAASLKVLKP